MKEFLIEFILFVLISIIVSFVLSISTLEDNPKKVVNVALKNFKMLFIIVCTITIIIGIINLF